MSIQGNHIAVRAGQPNGKRNNNRKLVRTGVSSPKRAIIAGRNEPPL